MPLRVHDAAVGRSLESRTRRRGQYYLWDQANDLVYSGVKGLDQQLGKVLGNPKDGKLRIKSVPRLSDRTRALKKAKSIQMMKVHQ